MTASVNLHLATFEPNNQNKASDAHLLRHWRRCALTGVLTCDRFRGMLLSWARERAAAPRSPRHVHVRKYWQNSTDKCFQVHISSQYFRTNPKWLQEKRESNNQFISFTHPWNSINVHLIWRRLDRPATSNNCKWNGYRLISINWISKGSSWRLTAAGRGDLEAALHGDRSVLSC